MSKWTIISIILTVALIGIPTAANFYPPIFAGLADRLPLNLILKWMGRVGILSLGLLGGWWARGRSIDQEGTDDRDKMPVSEIEGCIQTGESCWQGIAEISQNGIVDIDLENRAYCPNCQTVMYDGESSRGPVSSEIGLWECPKCNYSAFDEGNPYRDAERLFESHIRQIVESDGEDYSFDNLINEIDEDVTPRRIWEQYAGVVDDSNVSLNCFP